MNLSQLKPELNQSGLEAPFLSPLPSGVFVADLGHSDL